MSVLRAAPEGGGLMRKHRPALACFVAGEKRMARTPQAQNSALGVYFRSRMADSEMGHWACLCIPRERLSLRERASRAPRLPVSGVRRPCAAHPVPDVVSSGVS